MASPSVSCSRRHVRLRREQGATSASASSPREFHFVPTQSTYISFTVWRPTRVPKFSEWTSDALRWILTLAALLLATHAARAAVACGHNRVSGSWLNVARRS